VSFWKKGIKLQKNFAYISPVCQEAPLVQIYMKFCMMGHLADEINRAKFYLNQIRGFVSVGGSNFWLSHEKEKSPLTHDLNYHSACDSLTHVHRIGSRSVKSGVQQVTHGKMSNKNSASNVNYWCPESWANNHVTVTRNSDNLDQSLLM